MASAQDAAETVSMLESNAMSIEALEKAAQYGSSMDKNQVLQSLIAMTLHTTSAEMWCRVGMLRAARKMVTTIPPFNTPTKSSSSLHYIDKNC
jgi:hypothetical protein